jgi:cobalt/nickel transport system ATP-binding protein
MDEPTSNLDPAHRRNIINWIKDTKRTLIITTHDLDMIMETCDRIYILKKGLLVSSGRTAEILTNKKLLEENDLELPLCLQGNRVLEQNNPLS